MTDHSQTSTQTSSIGVQLQKVGRTFGETPVLTEIDLVVEPGEFSILIGPSGCGKTTLLRMMGRLDHPTSGSISYINRAHKEIIPQQQDLSYAFQEPRLLPWRTVYQNVALPLELKELPPEQIHPVVINALKRVGLSDAGDQRPHELSGGMKMRAAIARALVTQPRFLLLDEPFGSLDEITKYRLDDELLMLWQTLDVTIVLVTHSLSEAIYLGQRVHILSSQQGRLSSTLEVNLGERTPQTRQTTAFAEYVAKAHNLLSIAEREVSV